MTNSTNKGQFSTPENPGDSRLMQWIRDHLNYEHDYCLIWPFGRNSAGYGTLGRDGKRIYAHRYICELIDGPSPEGYQAAHSCGRGEDGCVNPRHLSWKSPAGNQLDRNSGGRNRAKLTWQQVDEIRGLATLEKPYVTAKRFNVTEANIRQIQSGKTWRKERRGIKVFTDDEVRRIRSLRGVRTTVDIAAEYGSTHQVIGRIQRRISYVAVSDIPEQNVA